MSDAQTLPQVDFSNFVLSLAATAMVQLGIAPDCARNHEYLHLSSFRVFQPRQRLERFLPGGKLFDDGLLGQQRKLLLLAGGIETRGRVRPPLLFVLQHLGCCRKLFPDGNH